MLRKAPADNKGRLGHDDVITNYAHADLAEFLVEVNKYAEAEELLQQAQRALLADPRVPALQRQRVASTLAKLYNAWGKPEQASVWRVKLEEVVASEQHKPETNSPSGK